MHTTPTPAPTPAPGTPFLCRYASITRMSSRAIIGRSTGSAQSPLPSPIQRDAVVMQLLCFGLGDLRGEGNSVVVQQHGPVVCCGGPSLSPQRCRRLIHNLIKYSCGTTRPVKLCAYVCACVRACVCVYVCVCIYICVYICLNVHIYIRIVIRNASFQIHMLVRICIYVWMYVSMYGMCVGIGEGRPAAYLGATCVRTDPARHPVNLASRSCAGQI